MSKVNSLTVVAHRGYSEKYTENSRAAFESAINCGANYIETDARLTADKKIICCHDPNLKRLTGQDLNIDKTNFNDLIHLKIDAHQPLLSLDDVLRIAKKRVDVLVDLKTEDLETTQTVLRIVKAEKALKTTLLGIRSIRQLTFLKEEQPNVRCLGFVADYNDIPRFYASGAEVVRVWEEALDHLEAIKALSQNRPVWVTAGNQSKGEPPGHITSNRIDLLMAKGVSGILLNNPSLITGIDCGRKP